MFFSNLGMRAVAGFVVGMYLIFCWIRVALWLLFRQWYIPDDKLAPTLEYDLAIMEVLPGDLRAWYMDRQHQRRWHSERKHWTQRAV